MRSVIYTALLATSFWGLHGCSLAGTIPNTDVPDTKENHEVIDIAERYRHAVERRDVQALLELASPSYYEDGGTPQGDDDYGYDGLRRLLSIWSEEVLDIRYEVRYRRVIFEQNNTRAMIDYTYTGSYTLRRPVPAVQSTTVVHTDSFFEVDPARSLEQDRQPEVWFRRVADNRLELEKHDGHWVIVAGM